METVHAAPKQAKRLVLAIPNVDNIAEVHIDPETILYLSGADFYLSGADFYLSGADFYLSGADFYLSGADFYLSGAETASS